MHSLPLYVYLLDRHLHSRPPELGREDEAVSGDEQERRECHQVADSRILPCAGSIMLRRIEEGRVKSWMQAYLIMLSRIRTLAAHDERVSSTVV